MNPLELEAIIGRELRQLPPPRAPHTLLPRVLAAVQAWTLRPWYERAWFTWPLGWQLASAAALILLVAAGGMLLPGARAAASEFVAPVVGEVAGVAGRTAVAVNAVVVLWRALVAPLVPYVFGLALLMCAACAAFGAALNQIAFGKLLQR
jgi:hypothetical protein